MHKTFEEAKYAAFDVINRLYSGNKMDCCITEDKRTKGSRKTSFGFRFHENDSNGEFIANADGTYSKLTKI